MVYVHYSLGKVYLGQKKYSQAKILLDKGLAICTNNFGDEHPRCGLLEMALGNWYVENGDESKGIALLEAANQHMEKWPKRYEDALEKIQEILSNLK